MAKRVVLKRNQSVGSNGTPSYDSVDPQTAFCDIEEIVVDQQSYTDASPGDPKSTTWEQSNQLLTSAQVSNDLLLKGNRHYSGEVISINDHQESTKKRHSEVSSIASNSKRFATQGVERCALETQIDFSYDQLVAPSQNHKDPGQKSLRQESQLEYLNEVFKFDNKPINKHATTGHTSLRHESQLEFSNELLTTYKQKERGGRGVKNSRTQNTKYNNFTDAFKEARIHSESEDNKAITNITVKQTKVHREKEEVLRSDVARSESNKMLFQNSDTSDESSVSSHPSVSHFESDPVLFTEWEQRSNPQHQGKTIDVISGPEETRTVTKPNADDIRAPLRADHSESRTRFIKNTPLETVDEITGKTFVAMRTVTQLASVNASLRIKTSVEAPKEYKLSQCGTFKQHTRDFKEKHFLKLDKPILQTAEPFSSICAEVPPENTDIPASYYDRNRNSLFASQYPVTLATGGTDKKMASLHKQVLSKSMTSLNELMGGEGITRYTLKGQSSLPSELKVVAVPPELQRNTLRKARTAIEMAISYFNIIFDKPQPNYLPGSELTGKVIMDVWSMIEIRYVEFVLQGRATVRFFGSDGKLVERPHHEVYLNKRIILLAPSKGEQSMLLAPGKYVSEFSYKLPTQLPSTINQTDISERCVFSISYSARANVCDFLHARHVPQSERYAQVVKACRTEFNVLHSEDIRSVAGAMEPIAHAEQFNLLCSPIGRSSTSVLVKLDHQVFALGDVMNLSLEVCTPDPKRIKGITAYMVQTVIFQPPVNIKFVKTVIKAIDVQQYKQSPRNSKNHSDGYSKNMYRCSFGIPVPPNLLPSLMFHARIIQVNYRLDVKVSFKHLGGILNLSLPVTLTTAPDADFVEAPVPLFSKPIMQFPYFTRGPLRDSGKSTGSGKSHDSEISNISRASQHLRKGGFQVGQKHERVRAKFVTCFTC